MLKFGGVEAIKQEYRAERRLLLIENLLQDLRFAIRSLRRTSGLTAFVWSRSRDTSKSRRAATKDESSPVSAPPLRRIGHRATLLLPTKNPRRERCANGKQHGQCRYVAHVG